jgi:hypothetical protein
MGIRFIDVEVDRADNVAEKAPPRARILSEEEIDFEEKEGRGSVLGFAASTVRSGAREVKDLAKFFKGAGKVAGALAVENVLIGDLDKMPTTKKVASIIKEGAVSAAKDPKKAAAGTGKLTADILKGIGESAGFDVKRGFDVDIALKKFKEAPIEATLDLAGISAIGKKIAGKGIKKVIQKTNAKNFVKKALDKDLVIKKELNDAIKAPFKSKKDDIIDAAPVINKLKISKLDEPRFVENVGKRLSENLSKLEKSENLKLKRAVSKVADVQADKGGILQDIEKGLKDSRLLTETNELDKALVKTAAERELRFLQGPEALDAKSLKRRLDTLDDSINWNTPKEKDDALKIIRRAYRNQLGGISKEYDEVASRIHDRLIKFEKKSKAIDKPGGGEKFGRTFFSTTDEVDSLKGLLKNNPNPVSGKSLADVEVIDAWHKWNSFFDQNQSFVPQFRSQGSVAASSLIPIGKALTAAQKRSRKALLKATPLTGLGLPQGTRAAVAGAARAGLEAQPSQSVNSILYSNESNQ